MVFTVRDQFRDELRRSFDPREWYIRDDDSDTGTTEGRAMWVYKPETTGTYAVGFYTPDREWVEDSRGLTKDLAASRVHYLNGGL